LLWPELRGPAFESLRETAYIEIVELRRSGVWVQRRGHCTGDSMARKYLGATARTWIEYLAAILVGNAIYYLSLQPHLPEALRHRLFATDLGLLVDFIVCVGVYGLIRLGERL
jgi:hypothetical protein